METVSPSLLVEMYRRVLRIRLFDEAAKDMRFKGQIVGSLHTTIGQEAEVVGACMALLPDDYMVGNHRSHGHPIGKGADMKRLMAELLGKQTGVCRGKGGSMHLADFSVGSLGETSIVGSGIPVAAGAALGAKLQGNGRICLCFFGDGASNQGTFHEGLNLAAVWKLGVVYLCENNHYAVTTSASKSVPLANIADRAVAYGIPGIVVDGQDVVAVYEVVSEAVKRARAGMGPSLIEAKTYRYDHHAAVNKRGSDYRSEDELAMWKKRDPVLLCRVELVRRGVLTDDQAEGIVAKIRTEVNDAVAFAHQSPYPEPKEAYEQVFTNPHTAAA